MRQLVIYILLFFTFSCSNKQETNILHSTSRETLNINFNNNINTIKPEEATTEAELFLRSMVYEFKDSTYLPGKFKIEIADDDILYVLKRKNKKDHGINNINIRFLKHNSSVINELLSGNLDIISIDSSYFQNQNLIEILRNPYKNFSSVRKPTALVNYYSFYHFNDSALSVLIDTLGYIQDISTLADSLHFQMHHDISNLEIAPNIPSVISSETYLETKGLTMDSLSKIIAEKIDIFSLDTVLVDSVLYDRYVFSNRLKGLENYKDLSQLIDQLKFDELKTY